MAICLSVSLVICLTWYANSATGRASQVEHALQRAEALDDLMLDFVHFMGESNWEQFPHEYKRPRKADEPNATIGVCEGVTNPREFTFNNVLQSSRAESEFRGIPGRDSLVLRVTEFARVNGMNIDREVREESLYMNLDGNEMTLLIIHNLNGAATLAGSTTCSDEWPDFSLSYLEFLEEYDKRYRTPAPSEALDRCLGGCRCCCTTNAAEGLVSSCLLPTYPDRHSGSQGVRYVRIGNKSTHHIDAFNWDVSHPFVLLDKSRGSCW